MIDVHFYEGDRQVAAGRWEYVPPDGMKLRLELPNGAKVFLVVSSEGQGVLSSAWSRDGGVPKLLSRPVRVFLADVTAAQDVRTPGDIPPAPPGRPGGRG